MTSKKQVYFIGIGGIGMSALARYYMATGWAVSGSDLQDSKLLRELRKEGIKVIIGHKRGNLPPKASLVVYNQAIPEGNPELKEARKYGIPLLSYPEAIGKLTHEHKTIAISGSHGKSTTTALISLILINAEFAAPALVAGASLASLRWDPTVIIGTRVKEFGNRNFRKGTSNWLVLEADEYGRAFHNYHPYAAVITNIDKEHLDTYKGLAGVKKSFLKFIENLEEGGILVLNESDKNLKSLEKEIKKIAGHKNLNVHWYTQNPHIAGLVSLGLSPALIGAHNVSNATGAHTLAKALGISDQSIYDTLKKFSGTWRRLEYRGNIELRTSNFEQTLDKHKKTIITVYDDYAHHPTEIRASLSALRESNSKFQILNSKQISNSDAQSIQHSDITTLQQPRHLICVFQPHQTERLQLLFNDFVDTFHDADMVVLLPVYQVAGRERESRIKNKELRKTNSEYLAKSIQKKYPNKPVIYLKNPRQLLKILQKLDSKFLIRDSILVMMGAGDIVKWTDLLIKKA